MVQGVLNIPIVEDTLAVRGVVYRFENSGYIENVAASQPSTTITNSVALGGIAEDRDDIGNDEYTGFRLAALWRPSDELDITLTYLEQEIEQDGKPQVNLNLANDFQQRRLNTGVGGTSYEFVANDIDITSLVVNYDLGWAGVTSASSWLDYTTDLEEDWNHIRDAPYFAQTTRSAQIFVEELRLATTFEGPAQFVAGYYYEDKDDGGRNEVLWSGDPVLDPGPYLVTFGDLSEKQWAVFGELTYQISEQWSAMFGGRHYDYDRSEVSSLFLPLFGIADIDDKGEKKASGETYKANLSWEPSDDTLIYAQWSEGFRLGLINVPPNAACDADNDGRLDDVDFAVPDGIDSDTTENFELGFKTALANNRIRLNAALYHIDWEGIPVRFGLPSCASSVVLLCV
jgi:outer membrane receptor protein involved in Fe transport